MYINKNKTIKTIIKVLKNRVIAIKHIKIKFKSKQYVQLYILKIWLKKTIIKNI